MGFNRNIRAAKQLEKLAQKLRQGKAEVTVMQRDTPQRAVWDLPLGIAELEPEGTWWTIHVALRSKG